MQDVLQLAIQRRQRVSEEIEKLDHFIHTAYSLMRGTRFTLLPADERPENRDAVSNPPPEFDDTSAAAEEETGEDIPHGGESTMSGSSPASRALFRRASAG
jgi:hypothetical protein